MPSISEKEKLARFIALFTRRGPLLYPGIIPNGPESYRKKHVSGMQRRRMYRGIVLGFICSILIVSVAGICIAADLSSSVVYVQGGESIITDGTDGMSEIIVKDMIPYAHITDGTRNFMMPVELLNDITCPLNAALVFTGADGESTSIVIVSNLSLSDQNKTLTLQVEPLEFYDGEVLTSFVREKEQTGLIGRNNTISGIYLEYLHAPVTNDIVMCGGSPGPVGIPFCFKN